jgi:hypothetical protein
MRGARSRSAGVASPPSRARKSGVQSRVWAAGIRKCASIPGQSPLPARRARSNGSRCRSTTRLEASSRTAIRGWAIWKPPRRGASQWPPTLWTVVIDSTPSSVSTRSDTAVRSTLIASLAARDRRSPAGVRDHLAGQAGEQRLVQALLQGLHLPADGGLADAQLVGGAGEALQARGGLEDTNGAERQAGEDV